MDQATTYNSAVTHSHAVLLDSVLAAKTAKVAPEAMLDSVSSEVKSAGAEMPSQLKTLLGQFPADKERVLLDAIADGAEQFRAKHGMLPTGDVIQAAIQQGLAAFKGEGMSAEGKKALLDGVMNSATSTRSDPGSLQPNRAVVATMTAISEAIPFGSYLPVDIGSNEAKLAILSHTAGSTFGDYTAGQGMDGVSAGLNYTSSSRMVRFTLNGTTAVTSKFTTVNKTGANAGYCDPAAGAGVPVLRGRTIFYVNGRVVGRDSDQGTGSTSAFAGSVNIAGTSYAITGTVTLADGSVSITPGTALPNGTTVVAEAFVNYETAPQLAPLFAINVDTFKLLANPWRGLTKIGIDSATQIAQELGLDGNSEAIISMRTQFELERHYIALRKVKELGINNQKSIDFAWSTRNQQMNRAQIFQDVQAQLSVVDQQVAVATMDHGITHYYVGSWLMGIFNSLPADQFVSSGITNRPGIFRVGRLFNKYEIYYTPIIAEQAADFTTAQMIGVGRASNVARCPIVLGDAVAPTFVDMAILTDFNRNAGIYGRNFTEVNPHDPSSLGCALVTLTALG